MAWRKASSGSAEQEERYAELHTDHVPTLSVSHSNETETFFGCKPRGSVVCSQKIVSLSCECDTADLVFSTGRNSCHNFCLHMELQLPEIC